MRLRVVGCTPHVLFARKAGCVSLLPLLTNEQGRVGNGLFIVAMLIGPIVCAVIGAVIGAVIAVRRRRHTIGWAMIGGVIGVVFYVSIIPGGSFFHTWTLPLIWGAWGGIIGGIIGGVIALFRRRKM